MTISTEKVNHLKRLRCNGYTIGEISIKTGLSKSTVHKYVHSLSFSQSGEERYSIRMHQLQNIANTNKMLSQKRNAQIKEHAHSLLNSTEETKRDRAVMCALLFWAEGGKELSRLQFTNSDPKMVRLFLYLLRNTFEIDETKLRALVHIHEYHDEITMKDFWSLETAIPITQFTKSYVKTHTGKRQRNNYKGCICIRYYDCRIALELFYIYNAFADMIIGV